LLWWGSRYKWRSSDNKRCCWILTLRRSLRRINKGARGRYLLSRRTSREGIGGSKR
jgi:hypothetical protein